MIVILSEKKDKTTVEVIKWIEYYNQKWIKINLEDSIEVHNLHDDVVLVINGESKLYLSEVTSFWYRRGFLNYKYDLERLPSHLLPFLKEENYHLKNYYYHLLHKKNSLGNINSSITNKLIVNDFSKSIGLKTPKSYILNTKDELKKVLKQHKTITKAVAGNGFFYLSKTDFGTLYTSIVENIDDYSERFAPTYFQEYIEKRYELRIFYLRGTFYPMAIFSQKDTQTQIDFRKYNKKKPNRTVPYKIPHEIEKKLQQLMKLMELDTASIDMIVNNKLEYYFLEVNPLGQFGMVSYPCNYYLEEKVAQTLIA
ncbi:MAG: grasp-with-spasm system ATP-grasp peptide maturase [Bacteroidota bacterium]